MRPALETGTAQWYAGCHQTQASGGTSEMLETHTKARTQRKCLASLVEVTSETDESLLWNKASLVVESAFSDATVKDWDEDGSRSRYLAEDAEGTRRNLKEGKTARCKKKKRKQERAKKRGGGREGIITG